MVQPASVFAIDPLGPAAAVGWAVSHRRRDEAGRGVGFEIYSSTLRLMVSSISHHH
jgi:hypothetical protein